MPLICMMLTQQRKPSYNVHSRARIKTQANSEINIDLEAEKILACASSPDGKKKWGHLGINHIPLFNSSGPRTEYTNNPSLGNRNKQAL